MSRSLSALRLFGLVTAVAAPFGGAACTRDVGVPEPTAPIIGFSGYVVSY